MSGSAWLVLAHAARVPGLHLGRLLGGVGVGGEALGDEIKTLFEVEVGRLLIVFQVHLCLDHVVKVSLLIMERGQVIGWLR